MPPETPWFVPLPTGNLGYFNLSYDLTGNEEDHWSFDDEAWFALDGPTAYISASVSLPLFLSPSACGGTVPQAVFLVA